MATAIDMKALEALCGHNLKLLETGELSDFSVVCGDRTWKTHKFILCRIGYFNKLITSGFKESHENQIKISNFEPYEIELLLRYIYYPSVDAEVACFQEPNKGCLETCVRLWQLGDYYGIETLATSAEEQLRHRTERYITEAGHMDDMLKGVPFVTEIKGAIRVAWDPEKAPGPHRRLLLSLCQALAPYLRDCPGIIELLDEIPGFASEFSKTVLGCGTVSSKESQSMPTCQACEYGVDTGLAKSRYCGIIYHPHGSLALPDGFSDEWYCSEVCAQEKYRFRIRHSHCEICKRLGMSK